MISFQPDLRPEISSLRSIFANLSETNLEAENNLLKCNEIDDNQEKIYYMYPSTSFLFLILKESFKHMAKMSLEMLSELYNHMEDLWDMISQFREVSLPSTSTQKAQTTLKIPMSQKAKIEEKFKAFQETNLKYESILSPNEKTNIELMIEKRLNKKNIYEVVFDIMKFTLGNVK